ncbi:unnamed protein product [Caenorhabditis angaria]|uniref:MD-2-related lipid-recognition domain-containing protein n=1 Tax=Caenorhabditis angaria TaxID=860376 RepID=A0A9P1N4N5_9PELO|nr:unnamed protein product [Caenorhabditis angaria]
MLLTKIALFSCLLVLSTFADFSPLKHKTCDHKGTILSVTAENFEALKEGTKTVAKFKVGQKPKIRIEFTAHSNSETMKNQIKAKIEDNLLDFPQPGRNACKFGVQCPVVAGQSQTFEQEIEIQDNQKGYNNIPVRWEIVNDKGEAEVCIIFLAKVV